MKYLCFYGDKYYPCGGANDFIGWSDYESDCIEMAESKNKIDNDGNVSWSFNWANIFSIDQKKVVWSNGKAVQPQNRA